jgi:hypothetical protein
MKATGSLLLAALALTAIYSSGGTDFPVHKALLFAYICIMHRKTEQRGSLQQ